MFVGVSDCSPSVNSENYSLFGGRLSREESAVRARRSAREWLGTSCPNGRRRGMLGSHLSGRCVLGVLVLPEEDLTVSDAGKLAGMRITDGVGKMPRVLPVFIVHSRDLLTNLSLPAFEWISLGEEE